MKANHAIRAATRAETVPAGVRPRLPGVVPLETRIDQSSLEDAFMRMTANADSGSSGGQCPAIAFCTAGAAAPSGVYWLASHRWDW
jgi:hypothetical protein